MDFGYWNIKTLLHQQRSFLDYEDAADGEYVCMGNSAIAGVIGKGKVILKLTSEKTLSLSNVLYVSSLRRNQVFGSLLNHWVLRLY